MNRIYTARFLEMIKNYSIGLRSRAQSSLILFSAVVLHQLKIWQCHAFGTLSKAKSSLLRGEDCNWGHEEKRRCIQKALNLQA